MKQQVPVEVGIVVETRFECRGEDCRDAEGCISVALDNLAGVVDDSDWVQVVLEAPEVFVERAIAVGVAVPADQGPAVGGVPDVLAFRGGGGVEAFFDAAPLVVVEEVAGSGGGDLLGATGETIVAVVLDEDFVVVVDEAGPVPGVPGGFQGRTFEVALWSGGCAGGNQGHVAVLVMGNIG